MKAVFLDIDGVLNSDRTLYEYISLEDDLILNLKELIDNTNAKIILSSSWRCIPAAIQKLMNKFDEFGLVISGMTEDGVDLNFIKSFGFTPTKKYIEGDLTHDRGAEIMKWLIDHDTCYNYVILDDDIDDIIPYFKDEVLIKTQYETGLTKEDVKKAINILNKNV